MVDVSELMTWLTESSPLSQPYPEMLDAIQCLRAEGIKTALLTNNFRLANGTTHQPLDETLFDAVSKFFAYLQKTRLSKNFEFGRIYYIYLLARCLLWIVKSSYRWIRNKLLRNRCHYSSTE